MGLFSRRKKSSEVGGIAATAVLRKAVLLDTNSDGEGGSASALDVATQMVSERLRGIGYDAVLEVRPPSGDPYEVPTTLRVPLEAERTGFLQGERLTVGLELPVRIDPADARAVTVDWDRFINSSGRVDALKDARASRQDEAVSQRMAADPARQKQMQDMNGPAAMQLAKVVRSGGLTAEEWERDHLPLLRRGQLRQEDYDAARALFRAD